MKDLMDHYAPTVNDLMERYAPYREDLAPRDTVARAMLNEVREGCGPDGAYVMLDLTH